MNKKTNRFCACHPAVTFIFMIIAIISAVIFQHPAYLLVSYICGALLYITLIGKKALKMIFGLLPLFVMISAINPLFNTEGKHILLTLLGRPYTFEALCYGMIIAGMLITALLWFSCYNEVMTSDKFTCLFGSLIPALSLVLVMVLRLIPSYERKASQISGARRCVGCMPSDDAPVSQRIYGGMNILSALTSWALEGAVETADSMRSRGYGTTAKRSSFQIYRYTGPDLFLLITSIFLFSGTVIGTSLGWTMAEFTPELTITPITGLPFAGLSAYALLLLIPSLLNLLEALKWKFFQSKI